MHWIRLHVLSLVTVSLLVGYGIICYVRSVTSRLCRDADDQILQRGSFLRDELSQQCDDIGLILALMTLLTLAVLCSQSGFSSQCMMIIFMWFSIPMIVLDMRYFLLPDMLTFPLLWLGLLINIKGVFCSLDQAVVGVIVGYLILAIPAMLYRWCRGQDGMGRGDFKLLAAIGAWLGYQSILAVVMMACFLAILVGCAVLLYRRRWVNIALPFGPFLLVGAWACFLFPQLVRCCY